MIPWYSIFLLLFSSLVILGGGPCTGGWEKEAGMKKRQGSGAAARLPGRYVAGVLAKFKTERELASACRFCATHACGRFGCEIRAMGAWVATVVATWH